MSDLNSSAVKNLLRTIEEDIDTFFKEDVHSENDAVYFLEQLNARIMSTIHSKEDKLEFIAIAGGYFYGRGLNLWKKKLPSTFWERIKFVFGKGKLWHSM